MVSATVSAPMASVRSSAGYLIAVSYAAAIAWLILLIGLAVYWTGASEIRVAQDREIAAEISRLRSQPTAKELLRELTATETATGLHGALFDRKGRRIAGSPSIPRTPPGYRTISGKRVSKLHLRIGATVLANGDLLVVGSDSRMGERHGMLTLKVFAGGLLLALAGSAIGGLVLQWYLRARLRAISATANAIVTRDLEWRVPVGTHDDEFDAAGRAVNIMLDRIAELMESLKQVSSDIAHDLRKPLMRLLVQTDRLGRIQGAEQRVLELGDELLMLFSGILRIAEVEGGDLERSFAKVDLSELMSEVADSFEPALADSGHIFEWSVDADLAVRGSRELLAQMASNLLDNARIHTPSGTRIVLSLIDQGYEVILTVEDNGPGVGDAEREHLLQRFYRAEASRTTPGNGLGLSLVSATARAHGGDVLIEDAGPGLRIIIRLPKAEPNPPSS